MADQTSDVGADFSVPLHQSMLRPMLLLGAERELILALGHRGWRVRCVLVSTVGRHFWSGFVGHWRLGVDACRQF
jgi:type IV secretory pathway TrbD component